MVLIVLRDFRLNWSCFSYLCSRSLRIFTFPLSLLYSGMLLHTRWDQTPRVDDLIIELHWLHGI